VAAAATAVQAMRHAAEDAVTGITVLGQGGPLAEPADVAYSRDHTEGIAGFVGASSIERLASERAIVDTTSEFSTIALRQPHASEVTS
jgi:predicted TIM-barrel enzyme